MLDKEPQSRIPAGFTFLRHLTWEDVQLSWKNDEDTSSFRREYREQGHDTWESWRSIIINPLHLDKLSWSLYDIEDPLTSIPTFRGGPFKPWEDLYYGGKKTPTFAEIVSTKGTDVTTRDKFLKILASSQPMQLIGLAKARDIFIVEGMHRCTALALAAMQGQMVDVSVRLVLAESDLSEFETIA